MCPGDQGTIVKTSKIHTHCQVCGGFTPDWGDTDPRIGYIQVQISWGPNSFDGIIDEESAGILGYAVYVVSDCGERQGNALATVQSYGIKQGTENCCNQEMYGVNVALQLAYGVTRQAFMVVPLTSIGTLDVGWVTSPIVDEWDETGAIPASQAVTNNQASAPRNAPASENEDQDHEHNHTSQNSTLPPPIMDANQSQPSPQPGTTAVTKAHKGVTSRGTSSSCDLLVWTVALSCLSALR